MPSMEPVQPGTSPRIVTSKRKIVYRESSWKVHQFQVWGGELVGRVLALKMADSLLLWVGDGGERRLGEVALGMPGCSASDALATTLLAGGAAGAGAGVAGLARRTAAALRRPVFVCGTPPQDRLAAPLLERALVTEMRQHPHCFHT